MANEHEPVTTLKYREDSVPRDRIETLADVDALAAEEERENRINISIATEKENLSKWYFWKLEYEMLTHIFATKNDGTPVNINHLANDVIKSELVAKREAYLEEADHIYNEDLPAAYVNDAKYPEGPDDYTQRDIPNLQIRGEVNTAMAEYISGIVDSDDPDRLYELTDEILQEVKPRALEQALNIYIEQTDTIARELAQEKSITAERLRELQDVRDHLKAVQAELAITRSELEARDMALWEASMHDKVREDTPSERSI